MQRHLLLIERTGNVDYKEILNYGLPMTGQYALARVVLMSASTTQQIIPIGQHKLAQFKYYVYFFRPNIAANYRILLTIVKKKQTTLI